MCNELNHDQLHAAGIPHCHEEFLSEEAHAAMHAAGTPHHHGHTHTHESTKAVLNRLSRAIGHLQSVKRMIEEGRDCSEVLVQIAAVRSAIDLSLIHIFLSYLSDLVGQTGSAQPLFAPDRARRRRTVSPVHSRQYIVTDRRSSLAGQLQLAGLSEPVLACRALRVPEDFFP